jgi:hypothetical protein
MQCQNFQNNKILLKRAETNECIIPIVFNGVLLCHDTCYTVVVSYRLYYMNHIPVNCYLDIRRIMQNIYILILLLYNKRNDYMINNHWLQFRNTWVHPVFTCISDWHMLSTYMSLIFVFRVVMSALQHCSVRVYSHLICLGCMYLRKLVSNTMFISEEVVFVQQ